MHQTGQNRCIKFWLEYPREGTSARTCALRQEILRWILKFSQTRQPGGEEWIYLAKLHNNKFLATIKDRDIFEQLGDLAFIRHMIKYIYSRLLQFVLTSSLIVWPFSSCMRTKRSTTSFSPGDKCLKYL